MLLARQKRQDLPRQLAALAAPLAAPRDASMHMVLW
jgi:hypothetical protein